MERLGGGCAELFELVGGVRVFGVEGEGFFVELNGEGFVAGVHVGFGEAVVGVGGLRVEVDIELEDADGVGGAFLVEQAIAERVDGGFADKSCAVLAKRKASEL